MNNRKNKIISYMFIMLLVTFVSKHFHIIANNSLLITYYLSFYLIYLYIYKSLSGDYMLCYFV